MPARNPFASVYVIGPAGTDAAHSLPGDAALIVISSEDEVRSAGAGCTSLLAFVVADPVHETEWSWVRSLSALLRNRTALPAFFVRPPGREPWPRARALAISRDLRAAVLQTSDRSLVAARVVGAIVTALCEPGLTCFSPEDLQLCARPPIACLVSAWRCGTAHAPRPAPADPAIASADSVVGLLRGPDTLSLHDFHLASEALSHAVSGECDLLMATNVVADLTEPEIVLLAFARCLEE